MRALLVNIKLNVGKVYHMQRNRAGITCYQLGQVYHLLLCAVAGVWRSMEVNCIDLHTALCDHIACHRAVNTAGQKQGCLSVGAHRHTARSRDHQGVNINNLADLYMHQNIRMMHIYRGFRECV